MTEVFDGSFTQQEPIPDDAIAAAVAVMQSGRLHRYNSADGEISEAAALEREFAEWLGVRFCVAVTSGGYAMAAALRAIGIGPGDTVLSNAFTLAPVPGAIAAVGARAELVGVARDLTIDLDDLSARINASRPAALLLSHMRGHVGDMDRLMEICDGAEVPVIEDCAHTMGARWRGRLSGTHGIAACFSTQTYKHLNSGEGGLITTNDPDIAARAVLLSGSYMFFDRHGAAPDPAAVGPHVAMTPNMSGRMDNLRAAILRPQLARIDTALEGWTARYRAVESGLRGTPGLTLIERPAQEAFVGSSIQFLLDGWDPADIRAVLAGCKARGVELKWFGAEDPAGFTSAYRHWAYTSPRPLPGTDLVLAGLIDMRLPLTFSIADCALISRIIADEVTQARRRDHAAE